MCVCVCVYACREREKERERERDLVSHMNTASTRETPRMSKCNCVECDCIHAVWQGLPKSIRGKAPHKEEATDRHRAGTEYPLEGDKEDTL